MAMDAAVPAAPTVWTGGITYMDGKYVPLEDARYPSRTGASGAPIPSMTWSASNSVRAPSPRPS